MVIPAQYDFSIYKGETFDLSLNWKDEAGVLYDLRTFTAALLFYDQGSGALIKELTSAAGGGITLSNVEFNIVARIPADQTATLFFGWSKKANAQLVLVSPDSSEGDRILEGVVTLHD